MFGILRRWSLSVVSVSRRKAEVQESFLKSAQTWKEADDSDLLQDDMIGAVK